MTSEPLETPEVTRTACTRCGEVCQIGQPPSPEARVLRRSQTTGLCATCAATVLLRSYRVFEESPAPDKLAGLLDARVQEQFGRILVAGMSDASLEEIDWQAMIDRWGLPMPKGWKPL